MVFDPVSVVVVVSVVVAVAVVLAFAVEAGNIFASLWVSSTSCDHRTIPSQAV